MGSTTSAYESPYPSPNKQIPSSPEEPPRKIHKTSPKAVATSKTIAINRIPQNHPKPLDMKLNSYNSSNSYGSPPVKVVILGAASVGKASFVNRTTKRNSGERQDCTTEILFKTMQLHKTNVTFQIVIVNDDMFIDEGELEDATAVFLMYDTTNKESFHTIESVYLPKLKHCCPYSIATVLIASKVDGWREVTSDEGKLLAIMNNMQFCEVSTKDNINLQKPFLMVAEAVAKTRGYHSI